MFKQANENSPLALDNRLIRLPEVMKIVPLCKVKIYQMIKDGVFPAPIKIGRASLWETDAIRFFLQQLKEGQSK